MLVDLSADIICSEKQRVFRALSSGKTVAFEEQIMSKEKYPNKRGFKNRKYHSDIPQV